MNKNILNFKNSVVTKSKLIWDKTKLVGKAFKREAHETEVASKIFLKIVERKKVTPKEIQFLKDQSVDIGKALALIGLQAVPGSTLAIIAIEKFGHKHGFTLFPKAQVEPDQEKNKASDKSS